MMVSREGYTFESEYLTRLKPGSVEITAPTLNDVIQINTVFPDSRTALSLELDESMIVLQRKDRQPLQVEYRDYRDSSLAFIKLFRKPLQDLVLIRSRDRHEWTATGDDLDVEYELGFENLIDNVALYAYSKQYAREIV